MFIDEAKIFLKSGSGGNGCVSFRRERYIDRGGPDGGNGGRGGNIIMQATPHLNTLIDFRYNQHFTAKDGTNGKGSNMNGASAPHLIIKVPIGTQILSDDHEHVIFDFTKEDDEFIILEGGHGGVGNSFFKSSVNRSPTKRTEGGEGDELCVWLKLKLLSDAGLVGLPNAGKSTFLSRVSAARPKIANYPFTTLKPKLGVVYIDDSEFVLADIPGLIEGAHQGIGLGDKFLKHIERCNVLIHLIDGTSEDPIQDYKTVRRELEEYSPEIAVKSELIALSKVDAMLKEEIEEKQSALEAALGQKIFTVSSHAGQGLKELLRNTYKKVLNEEEDEE